MKQKLQTMKKEPGITSIWWSLSPPLWRLWQLGAFCLLGLAFTFTLKLVPFGSFWDDFRQLTSIDYHIVQMIQSHQPVR